MDFLNDIKNETIVICNNYAKKIFMKNNKLIPVKYISVLEFIHKYYFDYDESTIMYVMDKYHVQYDIALIYINNLYYIDMKKYGVKKLDFLSNLKKELIDANLLIFNKNFQEYVKRVDIIVYDIRIDNFLLKMLDNLKYTIIKCEEKKYVHEVYSFKRMDDEVEYVAYNICKLLDNGVSIDNIKLTNVDSSYYNTIERIFTLFGLKVNIPYKSLLVTYDEVRNFINTYRDSELTDAFSTLDKDNFLYEEIEKIVNKYIEYENKELIIYKLEHSYVSQSRYLNAIEIVDYLEYISTDSEHVFMLGFNDGIIPNSYKDSEFITDNIKVYIKKEDTTTINKWLREDIMKQIGNIKNLTITYKDRDMVRSYYPSTLCSNFSVSEKSIEYETSYSEVINKLKLAKRYDEYMKYGVLLDDFSVLNNNFSINYNSFSTQYQTISRKMDKLMLSYSKMQIYNKCRFRYYLSEVLKLDIYEENFSTVIGRMVHYVMEKCLANESMDTDKYVIEFLGDMEFSKKEKFFLKKYQESIKELLTQVMLEKEYSIFNQALYEERIEIDYGDNIKFVGIIDKVLYYIDNNTTYVSLIDYKTGNDDISLKYLEYGINIQLPIYLYLSTKLNFKNIVYPGFYLQKFNISSQDYRLVGYSNSDKNILTVIDKEYDNSKIIKGMKTLKDGNFAKYTKVLNNDDIKEIIKITEKKILSVIDDIKNNRFDIDPKVSNGVDIGCQYCKFKDICFVTKKDKVTINEKEFGGSE